MKRITIVLSFVFLSVIVFGQGVNYSPENIGELLMEGEQLLQEELRANDHVPAHHGFVLSHSTKPGLAPAHSDHGRDGEWIKYWQTGVNDGALGLSTPGTLWAAIRWMPSDLAVYLGYSVNKIRIYMNDAPPNATAKIWQGDINDLTLEVSKEMPVASNDWVEVELDEPYMIDISRELWIGWRMAIPGPGVFPPAYENSNLFGGLANLVTFTENVWGFASDYGFSLVWNIEAFVEFVVDDGAPGAAQNFIAKPGETGILEAELTWYNPELNVAGEPLINLDEIQVFRGNELIHTIANPVVGGSETFIDTGISESGIYYYALFGVNAFGMGNGAFTSAFVGEDVPAAPGNVILIAEGNDGFITWDEPTEGYNNEYFSGENLAYTIVRMPDEVTVAENIEATEYLDTTVPGLGDFYYAVTASNLSGVGGTAVSNIEQLATVGVLMHETFDYPIGELPPGWTLEGYSHVWTVNDSQNAGGQPPELLFIGILDGNPPWTYGMSRLITYPIILGDDQELRLRFKQWLIHLSTIQADEIIGIDVTYDDGQTWETIWEVNVVGEIPSGEFDAFINVPDDKTIMRLAFRFDGFAHNIFQWQLDDIILEPVRIENDLAAVSISGSSTASVGMGSIYNIEVQNIGAAMQIDYTVMLMNQDGVELASVPGVPIGFTETISYELTWTPGLEGETNIYGYVNFPGDQNPGNNQTEQLNVMVYPIGVQAVKIGNGDILQRSPYNFFRRHSLSQTLYFAEEIGFSSGEITDIQYVNNFGSNKTNIPIKIWMGEPNVNNLTGGWVAPGSLQLVFDGTIDFPAGINEISIQLDNAYEYAGGNLLIYSSKQDVSGSAGHDFYNTNDPGSARTRRHQRDTPPYNPMNPGVPGNVRDDYPNITIFFSAGGSGTLEGTVTAGIGAPIEGARVFSGEYEAFTDDTGFYEIDGIKPGIYIFTAEADGYLSQTIEDVEIIQDETTEIDFQLGFATIAVDPESLVETLEPGETSVQTLTITNDGTGALQWSASIHIPGGEKQTVSIPPAKNQHQIDKEGLSIMKAPVAKYSDVKGTFNLLRGTSAYGFDMFPGSSFIGFNTDDPGTYTFNIPTTFTVFAADFDQNEVFYAIDNATATLHTVDLLSGDFTLVGPTVAATDLAFDYTTNTMYAAFYNGASSDLYTIDLSTGSATMAGNIGTGIIISMACDGDGQLFGFDVVDDNLYSIDKNSGTGTLIGPVGFNGSFAQSMAWDAESDIIYMAAYNATLNQGQLRVVDKVTGATELLGVFPGGAEICGLGFKEAPVSWLSIEPKSGVVLPGESMMVNVTFDATGLIDTTYYANININHNGQLAGRGTVTVPVELTVASETPPEAATLLTPENNATLAPLQPEFTWINGARTAQTRVVITQGDPPFGQTIFTSPWLLEGESLNLDDYDVELNPKQNYDWRVIARNAAGTVPSDQFTFQTIGAGTIAGNVTDGFTGEPMEGVTITAEELRYSALTGPDGSYFIENVLEGIYTLEASFVGYASDSQVVEVVHGDNVTANFALDNELLPPYSLKAQVQDIFDVYLSWVGPGVGYNEWIYYHDGTFESASGSTNGGAGLAQYFTPESYPCVVQKVRYYNSSSNQYMQQNEVYVLSGDGNTILSGPYYVSNGPADDWVEIDVSDVTINEGGFMVATFNTFPNGPYVGVDDSFYNGTLYYGWVGHFVDLGAYNMFYVGSHEAYVYYPFTDQSVENMVVITPKSSHETTYDISSIVVSNTKSYSPRPETDERSLIGFNIYRNGDFLAFTDEDSFDDLGLDPGTYSYTVKAVYPQGESEPAGPKVVSILAPPTLLLAGQVGPEVYLEWESNFVGKGDNIIQGEFHSTSAGRAHNAVTSKEEKLYGTAVRVTESTGSRAIGDDCLDPIILGALPNTDVNTAFGRGNNYDDSIEHTIVQLCIVDCPPDAIAEGELCGEDINGGCNADIPVFESIAIGDVICGTAWSDSDMRDTDWYELVIDTPKTLTWTVTADFPLLIYIIDGNNGCDELTILGQANADPCETAEVSVTVPPGAYWLWVGPSLPGYPCGTANDYVAELTAEDAFFPFFTVYRDGEAIADVFGTTFFDTDVLSGEEYCYTVTETPVLEIETGFSNELCVNIPLYELVVNPTSLTETHDPLTQITTQTIILTNAGDGAMDFEIGVQTLGDVAETSGLCLNPITFTTGCSDGDGATSWSLANVSAAMWVMVEPEMGTLYPGESMLVEVTFNSAGLEYGSYYANLLVNTNNPFSGQPEVVVPVELVVAAPVQHILMPEGWSGWSSYIDPAMDAMFADVVAPVVDNMIITQYFTDLFYPAYGINTMGAFSNNHGYVSKMDAEAVLTLEGLPVEPMVSFAAGWNLLPVLTPCNLNAADVFGGITGFIIAYEVAGSGIYYPEWEIFTLTTLVTGKAYWVKVTGATEYTFPGCDPESKASYIAPLRHANTTLWNEVSYTGVSHIVAFDATASTGFVTGDVIGAFTNDGICAGITIFDGTAASLALFGNDFTTTANNGFTEGEQLNFKLYRHVNQTEYILDLTYSAKAPNYDGMFANHGLSVINDMSMTATGISTKELSGLTIYPNPSEGLFNVAIDNPDREISYVIMDAIGQPITRGKLMDAQVIDLSDQPGGVYFMVFENMDITPKRLIIK